MRGQVAGSLIAALFGTVYVVVNSASLDTGWTWTLRAAAVTALLVVVFGLFGRGSRNRTTAAAQPAVRVFGRSYWIVVVVEVVALFAGFRVLAGPLALPHAGVGWVSMVVGVHFFALGVIFRQRFFWPLGILITVCGVSAMVLAFSGSGQPAIDLVGGVLPGLTLLAFAIWGAHRGSVRSPIRPRTPTIAR